MRAGGASREVEEAVAPQLQLRLRAPCPAARRAAARRGTARRGKSGAHLRACRLQLLLDTRPALVAAFRGPRLRCSEAAVSAPLPEWRRAVVGGFHCVTLTCGRRRGEMDGARGERRNSCASGGELRRQCGGRDGKRAVLLSVPSLGHPVICCPPSADGGEGAGVSRAARVCPSLLAGACEREGEARDERRRGFGARGFASAAAALHHSAPGAPVSVRWSCPLPWR